MRISPVNWESTLTGCRRMKASPPSPATWFPRAPIATLLALFVFDIRAVWLLLGWFVLQFFTGADSQVAWAAHVGGFVFGALAGVVVRQIRPLCRLVWREPWRSQASYHWDVTGGVGGPYERRGARRSVFGRRNW